MKWRRFGGNAEAYSACTHSRERDTSSDNRRTDGSIRTHSRRNDRRKHRAYARRRTDEELEGKSIIIGFTSTVGRDTVISPHDPYAPRIAAVVIAAQTLNDGPSMNIGFAPAFLFAFLA